MAQGYSCFSCEGIDCLDDGHDGKCSDALMCFSFAGTDVEGQEMYSKGCVNVESQIGFTCMSKGFLRSKAYYDSSCCKGDLCNNQTFNVLNEMNALNSSDVYTPSTSYIWIIIGLVFGVFLLLALLAVVVRRRRHKAKRYGESFPASTDLMTTYSDNLNAVAAGDSTLREIFEHSITSGSGSGLPLLVQRTLAKEIELLDCIGKGRFGEVWRGSWQSEDVAVKIFFSRDEASWTRETEIYNTVMLRHENILGYLGSDVTSFNSCTQLWLITRYHHLGSLYDYLNNEKNVLQPNQMMSILMSTISGLLHLHTEIVGTRGKPGIAHRDVKSKNILMKDRFSACLADFGLSVIHSKENNRLNMSQNYRVGTKRYMPPEVLDETIKADSFDAYTKADMYSLGLVMWEICRRCNSNGLMEEYRVPYWDVVPSDPSFEEMRKVVCTDGQRPPMPNRWTSDSLLSAVTKIIRECWAQNPSTRLSALRVKKSLIKIAAAAANHQNHSHFV